MASAIPMLLRCREGQRPKFTGPACETCGEKATEMLGAAKLCDDCVRQEYARRLRRED